jgi:hypothetical protein
MALIVRAFPVLPGKEEGLRRLAEEMSGREREQAAAFYRGFAVVHESWHLQKTPQGSWAICVTDVAKEPVAMARAYAGSQRPFDRWFKERIRELTGIDPDVKPFGSPTETIFQWDGGPATSATS